MYFLCVGGRRAFLFEKRLQAVCVHPIYCNKHLITIHIKTSHFRFVLDCYTILYETIFLKHPEQLSGIATPPPTPYYLHHIYTMTDLSIAAISG